MKKQRIITFIDLKVYHILQSSLTGCIIGKRKKKKKKIQITLVGLINCEFTRKEKEEDGSDHQTNLSSRKIN